MDIGLDAGLFGLDMLGGNLARCMAAQGASIIASSDAAGSGCELPASTKVVASLKEVIDGLKHPRILILRSPLDAAFDEALSLLAAEDVIVDATDLWFRETAMRARAAAGKGVRFLSMGLGANENEDSPLLMPAGRPEAYDRVKRLLGNAAPPAVLGGGPAGHFIKMTHAAVDCAFAGIVGEVQALLERGLGAEAGDLLRGARADPLFEYLGSAKLSAIAQSAKEQGRWAARAAAELEIPAFTLEAASGARLWENRQVLSDGFCQPHGARRSDGKSLAAEAFGALSVATIIAYTEGLALLATASDRLGLRINIAETLEVWRSGATLRGRLLGEMQSAFESMPGLPNLLFDDDFSEKVMEQQELLRHAVWQADEWNLPTPALAAALHYIDTFRDAWLPINLVQPADFHWAPRPGRPLPAASLCADWEGDDDAVKDQPFA
jgi:6-phosphogluconate dehydrogenase